MMIGNKWIYNNEIIEIPKENFIGFVYEITNLINDKKYIGKKLFFFKKTKIIKKKKKRFLVESDWKDYYGSNDILLKDVEILGKENFKREILVFCRTSGEMTYWENKFQFEKDVLLDDKYYNNWIMCKIRRSHIKQLMEEYVRK